MAFEQTDGAVMIPGLKAGADLSAKQYRFMKLTAAGTVDTCSAATDKPIGVLQNAPTSGLTAEVMAIGISKVEADAALATVGTLIGTSADGQADAKTPGTDTTEYVVGVTLQAAGAAAGRIACLINCASPARAA